MPIQKNLNFIDSIFYGEKEIQSVFRGETEVYSAELQFPDDLGPGPQTLIAGDVYAGFYGKCTQTDFGKTFESTMLDLGLTEGNTQNLTDDLLKFIHKGKIKYITQRNIRTGITWTHIQSQLVRADQPFNMVKDGSVFGGVFVVIGERIYKVRLMRGWGQVAGNSAGTAPPDYENGRLHLVGGSLTGSTYSTDGVNWPNANSPWNSKSPNEWNTLIFPIHEDSSTQTQTTNVPDWASYDNTFLNIGRESWTQENLGARQVTRGFNFTAVSRRDPDSDFFFHSLRLVFELTSFTKPALVNLTTVPTGLLSFPPPVDLEATITNTSNETVEVEALLFNENSPGTLLGTSNLPITLGPNEVFGPTIVARVGGNTGVYILKVRLKGPNKNFSLPKDYAVLTSARGPGPGNLMVWNEGAGFFGEVTQVDFGKTMTQVMSELGITQGTAINTEDTLLKFLHRGKVKFINRRPIRDLISWNHINERLQANGGNVYSGVTISAGLYEYKVRLMRGWGQVSTPGISSPDYQNGPLYTVSWTDSFAWSGNRGVNWPNNNSPWSGQSPNEWNTLLFPISTDKKIQGLALTPFGNFAFDFWRQTFKVPNWANYSNADLGLAIGSFTQESATTLNGIRPLIRGSNNIVQNTGNLLFSSTSSATGMRLVFELIGITDQFFFGW